MLHYFYGGDTYGAREAIDGLAQEQKAKIHWLDSDDFSERTPAEWLGQGSGGLFGNELFVVRGVGELSVGLQRELLDVLEKENAAQCVLWERGEPDKRGTTYRRLKASARAFMPMKPLEVEGWLVKEAQKREGKIDIDAAKELVNRVGVDRWRLIGELERLLLMAEHVNRQVVVENVFAKVNAQIFFMLDALVAGNKRQVMQDVQVLLAEGNSEFYLLSMLAYQFRTLLIIRLGIDKGYGQDKIAQESKLNHYSIQKSYAQANRFSQEYLRSALARILATDFAIKRGKVEARTGLMMLTLGLAR
jgi:DNA polymerase-3 subunit delta